MAGCCGWYKYNYNDNNNRFSFFFARAPALSSLSCLLLRSLCSFASVCVSGTIWSLFSNIFKVYCAKIYNQTRRDNTAAAAQQQQQQQNTSTTTTTISHRRLTDYCGISSPPSRSADVCFYPDHAQETEAWVAVALTKKLWGRFILHLPGLKTLSPKQAAVYFTHTLT